MVNFSDLSKMAEKLDVSGLVKNVKSMVNPDQAATASGVAGSVDADALSQKMVEITAALQTLDKAIPVLCKEIENLKKSVPVPQVVSKPEAPATEAPASSETDKPEEGPKP